MRDDDFRRRRFCRAHDVPRASLVHRTQLSGQRVRLVSAGGLGAGFSSANEDVISEDDDPIAPKASAEGGVEESIMGAGGGSIELVVSDISVGGDSDAKDVSEGEISVIGDSSGEVVLAIADPSLPKSSSPIASTSAELPSSIDSSMADSSSSAVPFDVQFVK